MRRNRVSDAILDRLPAGEPPIAQGYGRMHASLAAVESHLTREYHCLYRAGQVIPRGWSGKPRPASTPPFPVSKRYGFNKMAPELQV
jgi:hypothetical protein